jgi:hypothetical protein
MIFNLSGDKLITAALFVTSRPVPVINRLTRLNIHAIEIVSHTPQLRCSIFKEVEMSFWISSVLSVLLLQTIQVAAQQENGSSQPAAPQEVIRKKDWSFNQAYSDVYKILSSQNTCSNFYGGPGAATIVFNGFVRNVKSQPLTRDVAFRMAGRLRLIREPATGASYRLFESAMVNTNGSFYQRRDDPLRKFPSDVGRFSAGSRQARALILLHELGHLIQDENGDWLLPDDDHNGAQSRANTLRVEQECREQLKSLK